MCRWDDPHLHILLLETLTIAIVVDKTSQTGVYTSDNTELPVSSWAMELLEWDSWCSETGCYGNIETCTMLLLDQN